MLKTENDRHHLNSPSTFSTLRLVDVRVDKSFTTGYSGSAMNSSGGRQSCTNRGYAVDANAARASSKVNSWNIRQAGRKVVRSERSGKRKRAVCLFAYYIVFQYFGKCVAAKGEGGSSAMHVGGACSTPNQIPPGLVDGRRSIPPAI